MKKYLCVCGILCVMLLCSGLISGCSGGPHSETAPSADLNLPWENGGKQPSEYTWEEFEKLDGSTRVAFQRSFGSMEGFNQWMMAAKGIDPQPTEPVVEETYDLELPWENGGKQPSEYTWAEFEALDGSLQIAFQNSFGSMEGFNQWMMAAKGAAPQPTEPEDEIALELPWENGGKQPSEYTWAEFEALDGGLQIAFQNSFGSMEGFDQWMMTVKGADPQPTEPEEEVPLELPWENGGKQPSEYTWAEFEALDGDLQIPFQQSFGSYEAFSQWMQTVNGDQEQPTEPEEDVALELPWENGGKQPSEYTWAEFEALDGGLQIAFQQSFGSIEEFDEWLQRVHP